MNALARWIDSQCGRRSHLVVMSPDGRDNFALFGGFRARHRFASLYFRDPGQPRTRIALHAPVGSDHCRQLARRYGLVVFCGDTAPADLARELLTLPLGVDLEMDTPEATTGPGTSWTKSAKSNISRVRRGRFDWDVVTDPALIAEFHRRMYRPSMRGRHGAEAYLESRRRLVHRSRLEGLELLRVFQDGQWVAANLNESSSRGYRLLRLGWLNGDQRLLESGVVAACYWFSFQRAKALGQRRLLLGSTDPHLENGVFLYKGHWGARLSDEQRDFGAFQLLLDPAHPSCRRFLDAHSLIVRGSGGALVVFSARTPAATVVAPGVLRGLRRWYTWRESPLAGPEGHADEVPLNLRPWVGASML